MTQTTVEELPALASAFERRYPGVRVVALLYNKQMQELRFEARRGVLEKRGLIQPLEKRAKILSEFGAIMHLRHLPNGLTMVQRFDYIDEGAINTSRPRSNPENAKTRAVVARALKRIMSKSPA